MADKIIPRWEWRTFGQSFGAAENRIKELTGDSVRRSTEKYILSTKSNENCKIRDDLMDVKSLQQVNEDKLEQWYPTLKEGFPISKEAIKTLFTDYFKVDVPALEQDNYTYEEFLDLVGKQPDLRIVDVTKERFICTINGATVEIANATFNGVPDRTVCVEHIDPALVISTVRELGLEGYENINYIHAMKRAVGLKG